MWYWDQASIPPAASPALLPRQTASPGACRHHRPSQGQRDPLRIPGQPGGPCRKERGLLPGSRLHAQGQEQRLTALWPCAPNQGYVPRLKPRLSLTNLSWAILARPGPESLFEHVQGAAATLSAANLALAELQASETSPCAWQRWAASGCKCTQGSACLSPWGLGDVQAGTCHLLGQCHLCHLGHGLNPRLGAGRDAASGC